MPTVTVPGAITYTYSGSGLSEAQQIVSSLIAGAAKEATLTGAIGTATGSKPVVEVIPQAKINNPGAAFTFFDLGNGSLDLLGGEGPITFFNLGSGHSAVVTEGNLTVVNSGGPLETEAGGRTIFIQAPGATGSDTIGAFGNNGSIDATMLGGSANVLGDDVLVIHGGAMTLFGSAGTNGTVSGSGSKVLEAEGGNETLVGSGGGATTIQAAAGGNVTAKFDPAANNVLKIIGGASPSFGTVTGLGNNISKLTVDIIDFPTGKVTESDAANSTTLNLPGGSSYTFEGLTSQTARAQLLRIANG